MTTRTIVIYGASDDLIEIEGGGLDDEHGGDKGTVVLLPAGDRFDVRYGEGGRAVWTVEHAHASGALVVAIEKAPADDDPDPYTDRATVTGEIERVQFWKSWPPTMREIRGRVESAMDDMRRVPDDVMRRVWEALGSP